MRALRAHTRITSWLATLALLVAALLPALGQAAGAGQVSPWDEVCTAQGARGVPGNTGGNAPAAAHSFEHCVFCSLHAPALGLPPTISPMVPLPAPGLDAWQASAQPAVQHPQRWAQARPRAPPASC